MNPQKTNQSTFFSKTLFAAIFVASIFCFTKVTPAFAVTQEIKAINQTQTPGSTSYGSSVGANPNDTVRWRIANLAGDGTATSFKVILPSDLSYVDGSVSIINGLPVTPSLDVPSNTITFTFAPAISERITFDTTVAGAGSLSQTHTWTLPFYVNDVLSTSSGTLYTGAVITSVSPTSGANSSATPFTVSGHGFTTASQ
ncbi:MAG: hypothetical protein Q8L21_01535, partial [Candidatus Komeilibacteria bacterium]|nr:hypothetical protein [Candidatus Komeilibacteria bacterium]